MRFMKQIILKYAHSHLILSFILSLILIVAAIGKLSSPVAAFPDVDYAAAVFEVGLALGLIAFSARWEMWALAGIVFASWAGFSLFWMTTGLSCTCLGSWMIVHPGITFASDLAFIGLSGVMVRRLGASFPQLAHVGLFCLPISMIGFIIGYSLYSYYL
jgi:hypothetical protein